MKISALVLPLLLAVQMGAADFAETAQAAQANLESALLELAGVQEEIAREKLPLTRRLRELETSLLKKREELERLRRLHENRLVDLNVLKSEAGHRAAEMTYMNGLLNEYARQFETRLHIAEAEAHAEVLAAAHAASDAAALSPAEKVKGQLSVLEVSLARLRNLAGGAIVEGKALAPSGALEAGRFILQGPLALFASDESALAGLAATQTGSPKATVVPLDAGFDEGIRELARSGIGTIPLDSTLGSALKIASTKETIAAHIRKGGPVMIPILLLGTVALLIAVVKWKQIALIQLASPADLQSILGSIRRRDKHAARNRAATVRGPLGELLLAAIDHCHEKKEYIEEVLYEKMLLTKPRLDRLLPVIALTAATAPLLGLLGTVTGMINTFNMITVFGTGDPRTLASGISEALITTEFGLIVAVPALLLHAFLSRKAKGVLGNMEQTAVAFINGVPEPQEEERSDYAGNVLD